VFRVPRNSRDLRIAFGRSSYPGPGLICLPDAVRLSGNGREGRRVVDSSTSRWNPRIAEISPFIISVRAVVSKEGCGVCIHVCYSQGAMHTLDEQITRRIACICPTHHSV